jgi:hypothetical protein
LKWISEKLDWWYGLDSSGYDSNQWIDVVNTAMNILLFFSSAGYTVHCGPWPPAPTASRPDKIGSGFTYKCHFSVHLPVGSDWLSEAVL